MRRRLFIPGTGGCFFADQAGGRHASIFDLALDHHKDFICEHAASPEELAPRRTSGLNDAQGNPVSLRAAGPIRSVYKPFFDETAGPSSARKVDQFFDYDWRRAPLSPGWISCPAWRQTSGPYAPGHRCT